MEMCKKWIWRATFGITLVLATFYYRTSADAVAYKEEQCVVGEQENFKEASQDASIVRTELPEICYAGTVENSKNEIEPETVFIWIERCNVVLGSDENVPEYATENAVISFENEDGTVSNLAGVSWVGYFLEDGTELEIVEDVWVADGYMVLVDEYGGKYVMEMQTLPEDREYIVAYATVITEPALPDIEMAASINFL